MKRQTSYQTSLRQELLEKALESEKCKIMLEEEVQEDIKETLTEYLTEKIERDIEYSKNLKKIFEDIIKFDCSETSYLSVYGELRYLYKPTDKTEKLFEEVVEKVYNLKMGVKNSD